MRYIFFVSLLFLSACGASDRGPRLDGANTDKTFIEVAECVRDYIRRNTGSGSLNMGPETAIAYYSGRAKVVVRDVRSFDTIASIEIDKRGSGAYINNARFGFGDTDPFGNVASEIESATQICR